MNAAGRAGALSRAPLTPRMLEGLLQMKLMTLAAACAALVTLSAAPALAAAPVTAQLQTPVPEKTKFIAGGDMFVCEGAARLAHAPTSTNHAHSPCTTNAAKNPKEPLSRQ